MIRSKTVALLILGVPVSCVTDAAARRTRPPKVPPLTHDGIRYVAPNRDGRTAYLEAYDAETGTRLWTAPVFKNRISPGLEPDVHWVFITTLEVRGDRLVVIDERNRTYTVDLKFGAVFNPYGTLPPPATANSGGPSADQLAYLRWSAIWVLIIGTVVWLVVRASRARRAREQVPR